MMFGSQIKENLDLLFFSLLNLIFFICYSQSTNEKENKNQKSCINMPYSAEMIQYTHLIVFATFLIAFLIKSFLISVKNKEDTVVKWGSCLLNIILFILFFGIICISMNLFYVHFILGEDCSDINKIVDADLIILIICFFIFSVYRLCVKTLLEKPHYIDYIEEKNVFRGHMGNSNSRNMYYGAVDNES